MELRHLRYFIAVAEQGSVKVAAEQRLHTAQPSLSRQIRDLEREVGTPLLIRSAKGIELTAAGRVFLDHARLALAQVEVATQSARRAAQPSKPVFAVGVLTGHEADCLPAATSILQEDLPSMEMRVFSGFSVNLADDLRYGRLDVAFLRKEPEVDLEYRRVMQEPLIVIMRSDHRLASHMAIDPRELAEEIFIGISRVPRILRANVNAYLARAGVIITPQFEIDNFAMAISLVISTRGVGLLPASIESYLPPAMTSRPLIGEQPTIELMLGFHKDNTSSILKKFLSHFSELTGKVEYNSRNAINVAR